MVWSCALQPTVRMHRVATPAEAATALTQPTRAADHVSNINNVPRMSNGEQHCPTSAPLPPLPPLLNPR